MKWDVRIKRVSAKRSKSYYIMQSVKDVMSLHTIRGIYFAHFHYLLRYGLLLWGGDSESESIFGLQKRVTGLKSTIDIL
jgi:hypothetical protein